MAVFDIIAFDADDTLWHSERLYVDAQARFVQLLAHYRDPEWVRERLFRTEMRNMQHFGYGVKAFALSMIETAVELTEGQVSGHDIQTLIGLAKEMLGAEVELLPHVGEAIPALAARYPLMVITKGDLLDLIVASTEEGVRKPAPRSYDIALERLAIMPSEAVFIDDTAENVAAAQRLIMHAVLFHSAVQTIGELEALLAHTGVVRR